SSSVSSCHTPGSQPSPSASATDRKSTRLNSSHANISYAVFCLKKKKNRFTHLPCTYHGNTLSSWLKSCPAEIRALGRVRLGFFFFNDAATTEIYTLSLHDALPI